MNFLSILLLCTICSIFLNAESDANCKVIDIGSGLIRKETYSNDGKLLESVEFNKKTLKPHGARIVYDENGREKVFVWFIEGESVSKGEFEQYLKNKTQVQKSVDDDGKNIFELIEKTSRLWDVRQVDECISVLEKSVLLNNDEVVLHILKAGILWYGKENIDQAIIELNAVMKSVDETDSSHFEDKASLSMLKGLVKNYLVLIEVSKKENRTAKSNGLIAEHLAPFSELVSLYVKARGLRLSKSLKELDAEIGKTK